MPKYINVYTSMCQLYSILFHSVAHGSITGSVRGV